MSDTLTDFTDYVPPPELRGHLAPLIAAALQEAGHGALTDRSPWVLGGAVIQTTAPTSLLMKAHNLARLHFCLPTFANEAEYLAYQRWGKVHGRSLPNGGGDA